jgi:hypothetical protein
LLSKVPRGTPLGVAELHARGLTSKQAARYAQDGWLKRLGHGVYALPADQLDRDACLAWLASVIPGLHVAGKTALAWRGVRHNLAYQQRLGLWGNQPAKLPAWFTSTFPATYQTTHLFDDTMPSALGLAPLPAGREDVLVSTPERALLELLSDVGKGQGLEEVRHLVESARTLRMAVLEELLGHLKRIKVARLAHALAEELELPWRTLAQQHSARLGGGLRWVTVTPSGERLDLKRPA